jgi:hypothetical protein
MMIAVECCGEPRESRFCPDCGKELQGDPLMSLLAYLRLSLKSAERNAKDFVNDDKSRLAISARRQVEKWRGWIEAIESVKKQ